MRKELQEMDLEKVLVDIEESCLTRSGMSPPAPSQMMVYQKYQALHNVCLHWSDSNIYEAVLCLQTSETGPSHVKPNSVYVECREDPDFFAKKKLTPLVFQVQIMNKILRRNVTKRRKQLHH